MSGDKEKTIAKYASEKNALIDNAAIKLLSETDDSEKIIDEFVKDNVFIITEKDVSSKLVRKETKVSSVKEVVIKKSRFRAVAKDISPNFRIMEEYDVTGQSNSEGKVGDFLKLFRDKYNFLYSVLVQRPGFSPKPIAQLERAVNKSEFQFVGMVNKKWKTKNGHIAVQFEDEDSECIGVILKDDRATTKSVGEIVLDDVIGIRGTKLGNEMVAVKEIFRPDLMKKTPKKVEQDLSVIVTSDTHIGSKLFLENEFSRFISWLNGNVSSEAEKERIGKIKYMFIVGDTVDGVGVYPDQYDELAIKDIFEQYNVFTEYIKQIPEYIQVFICPGQHDAVRRADPQPAIPKEYVKDLSDYGNVFFIGSPGWVEMEGLKCLVYHGASLHDLYGSVNFLSNKEPQKAMIELLKRRDIMVGYGKGNPYVPERKDFMLIREEPDFYFGGDMHHNGYEMYRGCMVVNPGTWQKQTEFQIKMGHDPTPGIVPEIELKTRKIRENVFSAKSE